MTAKVPDDYFLRAFDRHREGEARFRAACAHAALLYNGLQDTRQAHAATLAEALEMLKQGRFVEAALFIQTELREAQA